MELVLVLIALGLAFAAFRRATQLKQKVETLQELVKIIGAAPLQGGTSGRVPSPVDSAGLPSSVPRIPRPEASPPEPPDASEDLTTSPPIVVRPSGIPSAPIYPESAGEPVSISPASLPSLQEPDDIPRQPHAIPGARPVTPPPAGGIGTLEARIGGSVLNRVGIVLLVIGIAFALGYSLTVLGPAGKAGLATATSLLLIVGGVLLERREPYRFYGRGLIGGGWAALYATAYAVHELQATRIIEDPRAGFALLLLVGLGMIAHSLRYENQGLTSIAYGLAYAAIVLHSISAFTLAAATLLGLGTVLHLTRRNWYGVAFGGMAATYGSLFLWYSRQDVMTPGILRLGLGALAIDWCVFLVADFSSDTSDEIDRVKVRAIALLNALSVGLLAFLAWTRMAPRGGWQPLLALGAAYVVTSLMLRRMRRLAAHPIHSLVATLFVGAAAQKGLSRDGANWAWLAEAQLLAVLGAWLKDRFHRWMGCLVFSAPLAVLAFVQIHDRALRPDGSFNPRQLLLAAAICSCLYFSRRRPASMPGEPSSEEPEELIRTTFSYAAFFLILLELWVQLPGVYVAPASAALLLLFFELSAAGRAPILRVQAYLAGAYAALMGGALSASSRAQLFGTPARVPALLAVAAGYYFIFLRQRRGGAAVIEVDAVLRPLFSWLGTALVVLIVWLQARPVAIGPAWMILALVLVEAGLSLAEPQLRQPGYLVLLAAHASLAMSNLTATDQVFGWSVRALTVVPSIAATYYLWWRLRALPPGGEESPGAAIDETYGRIVSYLGAAQVGLFARFEFGLEAAALRWSLAMLILFAVGHFLRDADFRIQAYALSAGTLVRAVGFDFRSGSRILGMNGPLLITMVGVACFVGTGVLVRVRKTGSAQQSRGERRTLALESRLESIGQDMMWLLAVALAAIYLFRTRSGILLIVAWALEGLAVTAAGFLARTPSLRFSGLALLALALGMTLYRTFMFADTVGRIISFIVLGVILLLISFGYARYRGSIRRSS